MGEYAQGKHPNTLANLQPFKKGKEWTGRKGSRPCGLLVKRYWNELMEEDDDGVPKYTLNQFQKIAGAKPNSKIVSMAKRIAARNLIDAMEGGSKGREILSLMFDRIEGKAPQSLNLTGGPDVKRIILVDNRVVTQNVLPEAEDEGVPGDRRGGRPVPMCGARGTD